MKPKRLIADDECDCAACADTGCTVCLLAEDE